ncbi:MAG TPA: AMP-binding protein [Candidatus Brevibacterium intestinigallinarum]|nr:AMP-binding protein [Candidatus Brevibacterium intestinigallinarum]
MSTPHAWEAAAAQLAGLRDLWPADVPRTLDEPIPDGSVIDYLRKWSTERPDAVAIHFYGRDITFAELDRASAAYAGWLRANGVEPGDRAGVFLPNCPQFAIAFLGILRAGAVYVPINPMFRARELAHELSDAGVRVLLALPEFAPLIAEVGAELGVDLTVGYTQLADTLEGPAVPPAPFEPVDPDQPSDWPDIMAHAPAPEVAVDLDALAALNYTGGTTGLPKGCEHTQRHMVYTALTALLGQGSTPGEGRRCTLGFLPMFWIAGQNLALLCPLVDGSEVVILTRWNASAALELIESRRVTFMSSPVENYVELLEHPNFSSRAVESLTTCTSLSFVRKLDIPMRERWREATGVTLRTGPFGMTESHTSDTFTFGLDRDDQDLKAEPVYCGYPVPGTSIVIVDDELEPVPQGETGQILLHSPSVLTGYYGNPEATAKTVVDGWLLTGDTGRFDEHGALTYLARTKEMIKVKGMSVFPSEVEALLRTHPAIERVAVAPREDAEAGQKPVAFIELREDAGADATADGIRAWAKEQMATYKVPEVVLVDSMPMTATGKIRKTVLVESLGAVAV